MPTIQNPTPVQAATFSGMWIRGLQVIFPHDNKPGLLQAELLPYDGQHLLATGSKRVFINNLSAKRATDAALNAMLTALTTEVQRQAKSTAVVRMVNVIAQDPARPVQAMVLFDDNKSYRVADCFALAATDATFAAVFNAVLGEIAVQAGLTVTP